MGLSRPRARPVRARRRRADLLRSSSAPCAAVGSGVPAAASPCSSCLGAGDPPSAPAPLFVPAPPLVAGCVKGPALQDVGEVVPEAPPHRLSAAPAATLTAAAMLGHRRSDPAIGGRVRRSPLPKPVAPKTAAAVSLALLPAPPSPCPPASSTGMAALGTGATQPGLSCNEVVDDGCTIVRSASQRLCSSGSLATRSWATLATKVDDSDEEELAPMTPPATKSSPPTAQPPQSSVGCEEEAGGGWQEVLSRRSPCRAAPSSMTLPPRPIPAWLFGRCFRCLAHGHRAAVCRNPLRCSRCLENGHRARDCRNHWRPLASMACLAAPRGANLGVEIRHAPAACESSLASMLPSKTLCESRASVVSAPAASILSPDLVLQSALAAHAEQLQSYLARVESFLERAEIALCKLSLVPAMLKTIPTSRSLDDEFGAGSVKGMVGELYGPFSPRGGDSSSALSTLPFVPSAAEGEATAMAVAPVLQTLPELQELRVSPASPMAAEHLNEDSSTTLSSLERSEVDSTPIPPPPTHNADVLFAKELCSLLSSVEDAIPGCGRAIACLLTGSTIKGKSKKVGIPKEKEKLLKGKGKKGGAIGKAPAAA